MDYIIAEELSNGSLKYIKLTGGCVFSLVKQNLLENYTDEETVDKLLSLGDLDYLGTTPVGKSTHWNDKEHCRAQMRDLNNRAHMYKLKSIENRDKLARLMKLVFVFKDKGWYVLSGDAFTLLSEAEDNVEDLLHEMNSYSVYRINSKSEFKQVYDSFLSWSDMELKAKENNTGYYVFKQLKLIKTVNC